MVFAYCVGIWRVIRKLKVIETNLINSKPNLEEQMRIRNDLKGNMEK
jgi:hypothetical protein